MLKLVSIIVPCFNGERWLAEAIDSCLQQSYPRIEIIVVDDGSTDASLEVIESYADRITWETGPHRGGNYSRNRGFVLSTGVYVQYLDADDYLLPEKIERQVCFLEETGADVVYGDWRHKHHLSDGKSYLGSIKASGPKEDFLESLLADEQWVALSALLFTTDAVGSCNGWDESLAVGQDRDFFISLAMNDAKFVYQPGCYAIYRRYGNITVSTSSARRWLENHHLVLEKAEKKLSHLGKYSTKYQQALAKSYYRMARKYLYQEYPYRISHDDYLQYSQFLERTLTLFPEFRAKNGVVYNLTQAFFGFQLAEIIACSLKSGKLLLVRTTSSR